MSKHSLSPGTLYIEHISQSFIKICLVLSNCIDVDDDEFLYYVLCDNGQVSVRGYIKKIDQIISPGDK